jgi:hypothetical protein
MTRLLTTVLSCCALALSVTTAAAQTQPTPEQIEQMLEPMRPTAEHRDLATLVGRWSHVSITHRRLK